MHTSRCTLVVYPGVGVCCVILVAFVPKLSGGCALDVPLNSAAPQPTRNSDGSDLGNRKSI